ncbi:MAG TPA: hypothetical protein VL172_14470 [Kofleriaceae bacterium]|jgi:hypothetical protein|nr:hypothetical protein [Kofleriaceae bacterium]
MLMRMMLLAALLAAGCGSGDDAEPADRPARAAGDPKPVNGPGSPEAVAAELRGLQDVQAAKEEARRKALVAAEEVNRLQAEIADLNQQLGTAQEAALNATEATERAAATARMTEIKAKLEAARARAAIYRR